uniref:Complement C3 n=1 Tax=Latimeria chalumnae TaxID=7897 RepID=H3B9Z5_LATCH
MEAAGLLLSVLLLFFPAPSHSKSFAVLTAPNVLRVESEEMVVVEVHNYDAATEVTIIVQNYPQKQRSLFHVQRTLDSSTGYQLSEKIKIPIDQEAKGSKDKQFVFLQVTSSWFTLEKVILLSFHTGYIFIQTDKPLYTPDSTVLYRLFTVTHELKPRKKSVIVEFQTPEGIVVKRNSVSSTDAELFYSGIYEIPMIVSLGVWNITARYEDASQEPFSTQFEIKEYVLPSFEVKLVPAQKFFRIDTKKLEVAITCRYLYGKPISGSAYVLFGVLMEGKRSGIPDSLRRVDIADGKGSATLTREMLQQQFSNLTELLGHSIYVTASVLTSSGSDMVEAEASGIPIVTSPYKIVFKKTSSYFKPGMVFYFTVRVENPDESPASNVPVIAEPGSVEGKTNEEGEIRLRLNPGEISVLSITVKTAVENLDEQQQARATHTAQPYQTQGGSGNYLHIGIPSLELKPNENLPIDFSIQADNAARSLINYISYLITSKGKLIKAGRMGVPLGSAGIVAMSLYVTKEFIPSFRIVAYYHVNRGGQPEIVSDSAWVDVKDTCMGTLRITPAAGTHQGAVYKPGAKLPVKLEGDPGAKVGLVAVDKAVYVLSNKYKITQSKIWDTTEKSDIGCTPGGGANNMQVFSDAGLAFQTNVDINTAPRLDLHCPPPPQRKRRTVNLLQAKANQASQFQEKHLRECCQDGMKENLMGYSCEKRSQYILEGTDCVNAFLQCCKNITALKTDYRKELLLARSDEDEGYVASDSFPLRSDFPESWLWQVETLPQDSEDEDGTVSKTVNIYLRDSITTWEILAVSLSENTGICVAEPYEIKVSEDFFVDLRLPYSVVRNEQVEIRAVLYNYGINEIRVRVEFLFNEKLCSLATKKARFYKDIKIPAQSSQVVPYVVIPLELGQLEIEVKALVWQQFMGDRVKKKLKVVPEGILVRKDKTVLLKPETLGKGGLQTETIMLDYLDDIVPGTDPETFVNVRGEDPPKEVIENSIDGSKLIHLIRAPGGCAEQNMMAMTPTVIATHFLDATNQWHTIGFEQRTIALNHIQNEYVPGMSLLSSDISFVQFVHLWSKAMLTAYVVKVFAMAYRLVNIDPQVLCGSVKWLVLQKQKPDGMFQEDANPPSSSLSGAFPGSERDATLTAFVLIALLEVKDICVSSVRSLEDSIQKAETYLQNKIPSLTRPYSIAISAYALSLLDNKAGIFKLMEVASPDGSHWLEPGHDTDTIEATAYALLANLRYKEFDRVQPIVKWLIEKRYYGSSYGSTQATIIVFQALAQYQLNFPSVKETNLGITLHLPGRSNPTVWQISKMNLGETKSESGAFRGNLTLVANGQGEGSLSVLTVYYAIPEKQEKCNNFNLSVKVEDAPNARRPEKAHSSLKLTVCTRYLKNYKSTMAILDITMLSGYSPDTGDLNMLQNGVEQYIELHETDKALSDKGSLIIYLDKVSFEEDDCIAFKVHQMYKVGLIQPAAITVYEYYNKENRCTKFYHTSKESGSLNKICQGEVCRCAAEKCGALQKEDDTISAFDRSEKACEVGVDYVYKVKFVNRTEYDSHDAYIMEIVETIKQGSDGKIPEKETREFISHKACKDALSLQLNKEYLVMGYSADLWDNTAKMKYLITERTWIEWWPTEVECQDSSLRELCNNFFAFKEDMLIRGCLN